MTAPDGDVSARRIGIPPFEATGKLNDLEAKGKQSTWLPAHRLTFQENVPVAPPREYRLVWAGAQVHFRHAAHTQTTQCRHNSLFGLAQ